MMISDSQSGHAGKRRDSPPVSDHARKRWTERSSQTEIDVVMGWERSITVDAPKRDCDTARLYAPDDILFLFRGDVVTTVCPANYQSLAVDDLGECSQCRNLERFECLQSTCRWCGSQPDHIQMENGVSVSFGGGE